MGDGMKWGRRLASVTPNQPVAVRSTKASREDKAALRVGGAMRVGGGEEADEAASALCPRQIRPPRPPQRASKDRRRAVSGWRRRLKVAAHVPAGSGRRGSLPAGSDRHRPPPC